MTARRDIGDADALSAAIGDVYETVGDPERWTVVLDRLCDRLGAARGVFWIKDLHQDRLRAMLQHNFDPDVLADYVSYYHRLDEWVAATFRWRGAGPMPGEALVPRHHLIKTEFYSDFLVRCDVGAMVATPVIRSSQAIGYVSVFRSERGPDFEPESVRFLELLMPHFERALKTQMRLETAALGHRVTLDALDRLPLGIAIVDRRQRPVFVNARMEEIGARGDGIVVRRDRIACQQPTEAQKLRRMIGEAVAAADGVGAAAGGAMRVLRRAGGRAYEVMVAPFKVTGDDWLRNQSLAVVFVADPDHRPAPAEAVLAGLYGLTPAEVRFVAAFMEEPSVEAVSEKLAVTEGSARIYLKRVFAKTDVNSQAALMKLVLTIPTAALQPDES